MRRRRDSFTFASMIVFLGIEKNEIPVRKRKKIKAGIQLLYGVRNHKISI